MPHTSYCPDPCRHDAEVSIRFVKQDQSYPVRYDVLVEGDKVGEVVKKVEHYNLARPVTAISWYGVTLAGERTSLCPTRKEATDLLLGR